MRAETSIRETVAPPTPLRAFWDSFSQNRGAVGGLLVLIGIVVLAIFAEFIAPYS